jgi:5-methylcytosine-specific restriction endonuclease McrA
MGCYKLWHSRLPKSKARQKRYRDENPEKIRLNRERWQEGKGPKVQHSAEHIARRTRGYIFKRKYGISVEEYESLYQKQEGLCAICLRHFNKLAVDHNHETKEVRGLLCTACNARLGNLEDRDYVLRALSYLDQYEEPGYDWFR